MALVKGPREVADAAEIGVAPREDVIEMQSWLGAENFLAIPGPYNKEKQWNSIQNQAILRVATQISLVNSIQV